jgi:ribosomal protein L40E
MAPRKQFSSARKLVFYSGYLFMVCGAVLFLSAPLLILNGSLAFTPSFLFSMFLRALAGMALIALGLFLRRLGILGPAGSLLVLDAPRAREDLEPWSRTAGGLVDAALSEVEAVKRISGREPQVLVRCLRCKALNDEEARYCDQCGGPL